MSKLNPNAQPFVPTTPRAAQRRAEAEQQHSIAAGGGESASNSDERSLFMTFSNGSPVTQQEIFEHFTSEYGYCVEHVYVHKRLNKDPEFGKIIFKTTDLPIMMLENKEEVKILVNDKPVWLKKYIPQSQRNKQTSL